MGRPFVEHLRKSPKFVCAKCRTDVAASSAVIWTGYMGVQQPAFLFSSVVNVGVYSTRREERLSTGNYVLEDVECRQCTTHLGWHYVHAESLDQKYKEGGMLLQQDRLVRLEHSDEDGCCA